MRRIFLSVRTKVLGSSLFAYPTSSLEGVRPFY